MGGTSQSRAVFRGVITLLPPAAAVWNVAHSQACRKSVFFQTPLAAAALLQANLSPEVQLQVNTLHRFQPGQFQVWQSFTKLRMELVRGSISFGKAELGPRWLVGLCRSLSLG